MPKLTLKQELFAQEYMKANGNGTAAVRKAYPNITTERTREVMSSKLQKNKNIQEKINELKAPIFNSLPEIGEMVLQKLKVAFIECESHRDMDKLGRTLLEVGGFLSNKGINMNINTSQGPAINIYFAYNGQFKLEVGGLESLGAEQWLTLEAAIQREINKTVEVNDPDFMRLKRIINARMAEKAERRHTCTCKQTVNCLPQENNTNPGVIDAQLSGGDCLPVNDANKTEGTLPAEKKMSLPEEGSHPMASSLYTKTLNPKCGIETLISGQP